MQQATDKTLVVPLDLYLDFPAEPSSSIHTREAEELRLRAASEKAEEYPLNSSMYLRWRAFSYTSVIKADIF